MRTVGKWLSILLLLALGGFALWTWASLKFVYSSGERAGYVQKFSKKGWVFKTWEGELAMVNLPGAMQQIFNFSVRDPEVAKRISATMGQRVVLRYDEHRGIPLPMFSDTSHFITDAHILDAAPGADAPAASPAAPATPQNHPAAR